MKAIRTRYSGPTNKRGSRIHATDGDGNRVSVSYNEAESDCTDPHEYAAYSLVRKMGWKCQLAGGGFGHDQYWVMLPYAYPSAPAYYETYFKSIQTERRK